MTKWWLVVQINPTTGKITWESDGGVTPLKDVGEAWERRLDGKAAPLGDSIWVVVSMEF